VSQITVGRELIEALGELPVRQCFTVDALHNQRETAAAIMEANHDYLMAVKENQPSLYKAIEKRALSEPACSEITVQDNSHGRQVSRKVRVYEASAGLQQKWRG